jgi:hypothetical protein
VKTQKILSMKVTADDERIHDDSKAVPELFENILKSDDISTTTTAIGKLFGDDGAYEGNEIFRYLENNGIMPCIKVRNNARVRWKKGNILRNLSVLAQRNDLQNWKEDSIVRYGQRWVIETVFSSIKRMFDGEYVYSAILKNMIQEMMLKAICIIR